MATKRTKADKESLIYCGPNLPKGVLNQYTVYQNGIPKHLDEVKVQGTNKIVCTD
ncbi:hypothetical protein KHA80_14390 [Anaerobacillus sp. HL2]|nr:hypothetical protein KHA80_14390 [Anaerobacillus sp. HL2]